MEKNSMLEEKSYQCARLCWYPTGLALSYKTRSGEWLAWSEVADGNNTMLCEFTIDLAAQQEEGCGFWVVLAQQPR